MYEVYKKSLSKMQWTLPGKVASHIEMIKNKELMQGKGTTEGGEHLNTWPVVNTGSELCKSQRFL